MEIYLLIWKKNFKKTKKKNKLRETNTIIYIRINTPLYIFKKLSLKHYFLFIIVIFNLRKTSKYIYIYTRRTFCTTFNFMLLLYS
jgi:hypothetical protein